MSNFNKRPVIGKQLLTDRGVNSLVLYLNELKGSKYDPLDAQEEFDLFVQYRKSPDKQIKDKIINSNLRFVISVTKAYLKHDMKFTNEKAMLEDVINAGNIGMIKAFDKFDHTKGFKFLTYATWDIRLQIGIYLNETLADIRLPSNLFRIESVINKAMSALKTDDDNSEPSINQIVDKYNAIKSNKEVELTTGLLCSIRENKKSFISASRTLAGVRSNSSGSDDDMVLQDTFKQEKSFEPDSELLKSSDDINLNAYLNKKLSEREKIIVDYNFGLNGKEQKTLAQISDVTGLTRERVGQLLTQAIKKLKESKSTLVKILEH